MSRLTQTLVTVVTRFAGKAVNFVIFAILARTLSVADLGVYGFIFSTSLILATFFDFGTRNSVAFFIGQEKNKTNDFALQAVLMCFVFSVLAVIFAPVFYLNQKLDMPISAALFPAIVNILSLLFIRMIQGVFLGTGNLSTFNKTELAPRIALFAFIMPLLLLGKITLITALYALAFSNLVGAIAVAIGAFPIAKLGSVRNVSLAKRLFKRGLLFMLGVVSMVIAKQIAFLIISQVGSEGQAGLFYGLRRLTEILTEVGLAVSVVLFSHSVRSESRSESIAIAAQSSRISFAFFLALTVVGLIVAPYFVPFALGPQYVGYETLFRILLVGTLAGTIWIILFPSLTAIGGPLIAFWIFAPNLIVGAGVTFAFFQWMGLNGAAIGMVLSQVLLSVSFVLVFKNRFDAKPLDFILLKSADTSGIVEKLKRKLGK